MQRRLRTHFSRHHADSGGRGKNSEAIFKKGFVSKYRVENIYYRDEATAETIRVAQSYSNSNSSLLILGETGVGKELFAQSVYNASSRRNEPFVAINCASLPEDLLESELFGYVEGAFTGAAKSGKMGLFELAHNRLVGPNLQCAGIGMRCIHGHGFVGLPHSGSEKFRRTARENMLHGADLLKIFATPGMPPINGFFIPHFLTREEIRTVVGEAAGWI